MAPAKDLGPCPLCGRTMIEGSSVDRHHVIPKTYGGTETVMLHRVCHTKIHSVFDEKTLAREPKTMAELAAHPEIAAFVKWVRKQPPELKVRHKKPRP